MPGIVAALFFAFALVAGTLTADAAADTLATASEVADAGFGAPPSGEVPILFNDHTVYATPDLLKQSRVLAALVKDGQIYVPLRSMFEQMGATVTASPDGMTVNAAKPGSSVSVTVGKPDVIVNGESRPLDVPPIVYHGIVLVPVRVLSEAMGAYVQWVPAKRLVVVRYLPLPVPPPPATPAPTAPPSPAPIIVPPTTPAPVPTPSPAPASYTAFIEAALSRGRNYNEFAAGGFCDAILLSAAYAPQDSPFAVKLDYRNDSYVTSDNASDGFANHFTQFATIDGGVAFVPVFLGRQTSFDARLEFKIASPRIYVGLGYLHTTTNYGYPNLDGVGFGVEKLPDLHRGLGFFGSAFYYPSVSGTYTIANVASANNGLSYRQRYQILKYDIGATLVFNRFPVYLYGGYTGDRYGAKANAPIGQVHDGPYLGLGLKI